MTTGSKLSDLPDIGVALAQTDHVYVTRGTTSYRAAISRMRLLAAQISDSTATGQALMTAATAAAARSALGLGTLAVQATVGAGQIDAAAVTLAMMDALSTDSIIIGVANRPTAFPTGAVGQDVMGAATVANARTALSLDSQPAIANESAYTGIDNTQVGTVYATVADLNALRTSYNSALATLRTLLLLDP